MTPTRRTVLRSMGAACLVGLAGCTSPGGTDPNSDEPTLTVRISNQTDTPAPVTVRVTDPDGDLLGEVGEETVPANVSTAIERTGSTGTRYSIAVTGERWATGALWTPDSCRDYTVVTALDERDGTPSVTLESSCDDA